MKISRVGLVVLGALALLLGMLADPGPRVGAAPAPAAVGMITGRVNVAGAGATRLQFQVDGVRFSARFQGNSFTLAGVPIGQHTLSVIDPGARTGAHARVTVAPRGSANVGTLSLAAGGQITGIVSRVTDPKSGQMEALAGVEVIAEPEAGPPPLPMSSAARPQGVPPLVAVTDETGAYAFRAVPRGGYRVSVVVPGLEAGVQWVWVEAGRTAVADFTLRPAIEPGTGTISGSVTSAKGEPIPGATITVFPAEVYYPPVVAAASVRAAAQLGRAAAATPGSLPRPDFSTVTDGQGQYRLDVPSGYLYLSAYAEGFLPTDRQMALQPGESLTVDLTLEADVPPPSGALEGFVVDARTKRPLPNAFVAVVFDILPLGGAGGVAPSPIPCPIPAYGVMTDAEGHYRLDGLFVGSVHMSASAEDYAAQDAWVEIVADETTRQDFALKALPPPGVLEGTVVDAVTRRPLANAQVSLGFALGGGGGPRPLPPTTPPGILPPVPIPPEYGTTTDAQGRYRMTRVPDGQWQLRVGRAGYLAQTRSVKLSRGTTVRQDFRLAPGRR